LIVGAVICVLVAVVGLDAALMRGKIHHGVEVSGLKLGGKTRAAARQYLNRELEPYIKTPVSVRFDEDSWDIKPSSLGLEFATNDMVNVAYSVGRRGGFFTALKARFETWFQPVSVDLISSTDQEKTAKAFKQISTAVNKEPKDSRVSWDKSRQTFVVKEGSDGSALNEQELIDRLSVAVLERLTAIPAPVDTVAMAVVSAEAKAAARLADRACAQPITVAYKDKSWDLKPDDLARLLEFKRSDELADDDAVVREGQASTAPGPEVTLDVVVSASRVAGDVIPKLGADVGKKAKNAKFSVSGGKVTILPSEKGTGADPEQLARDVAAVALKTEAGERRVAVMTHEVEPKLTTEAAEALGITERISTYSTTYASGNRPRVNNIKLLAKSLDGQIIMPGETFSFNETIGERTAAKGYQEAGAIVNGELVPQLGGGICQVNTTLFNATLLSGVQITQRRNHSYYISHYPLGRDATVSWGGPDFKFKNTLDHAILIATSAGDSAVVVSFYGTDPGYEISLTTGKFTRKDFKTKEIKDADLAEGKRSVETAGIRGGHVVLTQVVKKGDTVLRTSTYTSNYVAVTEVVRVGTKKPKDTGKAKDDTETSDESGADKATDKAKTQPPTNEGN
jgi:vancomycin resistance protein YoaR